MGPGTTSLSNRFAKEAFVTNYVKRKLKILIGKNGKII